jgi:hypothetical protein
MIDLTTLERRGGPLLRADGRANRFRSDARLTVDPTLCRWKVEGAARLRARGLGRLVLLLGGRRIRQAVRAALDEAWASVDASAEETGAEVRQLAAAVEEAGGPEAFVRRALWDPTFDPDPRGR